MKCVLMALDLGNESAKLVDHLGHQVIPNVVCRAAVLQVYDNRVSDEDYINFSLVSPAAGGEFFVGNLAARQDPGRSLFMPAHANKAEESQYYITALGAIAYRALQVHLAPDDTELAVRLVISLPMRDWFRSRDRVTELLLGEHLLYTGSMPTFGKRAVSLHIEDVFVSIEGMAALLHSVYHSNGATKDASLGRSRVRIIDIGKETTDLPLVHNMVPQPEPESTWEDWGAGRYLDSIARKVRDQHGIVITNTAQLVTCIVHQGAQWKVRGRMFNLKPVVTEEFRALAERAARTIEAHFTQDVDACVLVGGAMDAIRPYLREYLNLDEFPVLFGVDGECYLENARGNYIMGLGRKWPPVEINYQVA